MRILWLAPYVPWPPTHGGKIRLYNLALRMLELGHHIEMWCIDDEEPSWPGRPEDGPILRHFRAKRWASSPQARLEALLSPLPQAAWSCRTGEVVTAIGAVSPSDFDVVILEQAHCGGLASDVSALGIPWVLNTHNVESWLLRQESIRAPRRLTRWHRALDAVKYRRLERQLVRSASIVIAVSDEDRRRLVSLGDGRPVAVHPNGVDLQHFRWLDHSQPNGVRLLMTGTLGSHAPNLDACVWLRDEIMPAIRACLPEATLTLVGGGMNSAVRKLNGEHAGLSVVGPVADVRPYFAGADIFIIPLRMGSGTRLKALEALACGLPIVATPIALEGLQVLENDLALVGKDTTELTRGVVRAVTDLQTRRRLVHEGRCFVERFHDWDNIARAFEQTVRTASGSMVASVGS